MDNLHIGTKYYQNKDFPSLSGYQGWLYYTTESGKSILWSEYSDIIRLNDKDALEDAQIMLEDYRSQNII